MKINFFNSIISCLGEVRFGVFAGVFPLGNRTYRAWGTKLDEKTEN